MRQLHPPFQAALSMSGYKYKLEYEPQVEKKKKRKSRKRPVTWFNPPFSLSLKTNVGKEFLGLLNRAFPPENPLNKLFNRQTVKIGYKCMPNMATTVARHNSKVIRGDNPSAAQAKKCDCEGGTPSCPVEGECRQKGVVYKASVTERTSGKTETYTGLTGREFKERWKEHQKDFENTKNRTKTTLSSHIWELKDRGLNFSVKWKILDRATTYNPVKKNAPSV